MSSNKDITDKVEKEKELMEGNETKDKIYSSQNTFSNAEVAKKEFSRSIEKLFNVNAWTNLPGVSSTFQLYNSNGEEKHEKEPEINDYIKILLPGPFPENWVIVTDKNASVENAEFTVSPSKKPSEMESGEEGTEHFFIKEASSTFKVELLDNQTICAHEIGRNEGINNKGKEAKERELINTLIAEGGWAGFQKFQWEKVTDYLIHKIEINNK